MEGERSRLHHGHRHPPHHPGNVSKRFTALGRTLDVSYLTLHGLRHTDATHLLAMGKNPRMVGEFLGHADAAFTLQVYGHVLPATSARRRMLRPNSWKGQETAKTSGGCPRPEPPPSAWFEFGPAP